MFYIGSRKNFTVLCALLVLVLPYNFRCGPHNSQLSNKSSRLADASFIVNMLYEHIY